LRIDIIHTGVSEISIIGTNNQGNKVRYSYIVEVQSSLAGDIDIIKVDHTELMSHKAVQVMFVKEQILKRKIFSSKFKSYLTDLLRVRNIADYHANGVSKKIASRQLFKTNEFVHCLIEEIEK